jgi:hypothetical protein
MALLLHLICQFEVVHPMPFTSCSFMLFDLVVAETKISLICLNFTGTLNHFHFTLLFICPPHLVLQFHLIVFMEHACLLLSHNQI